MMGAVCAAGAIFHRMGQPNDSHMNQVRPRRLALLDG